MDAHWCRWHHGTVTDPKWRVVARDAGNAMKRQVTVGTVTAVWAHMMECASQAQTRGMLEGWSDEAVGACIDSDEHEVRAIYDAMQGRTLDGNRLMAWEKRQPKRERPNDNSTERVKRSRNAKRGNETPRNASGGQETPRGEERREEEKEQKPPSKPPHEGGEKKKRRKSPETPMPDGWTVPADWIAEATAKEPAVNWTAEAERFVSHHASKGSTFAAWKSAWWTWVNSPYTKVPAKRAGSSELPEHLRGI